MKLYRFIPNEKDYPYVPLTIIGQWWPEGIQVGEYLEHICNPSRLPFSYEGNRYDHYPYEMELSDFPVFSMSLPVVSSRGADVLVKAALITDPVPMTISDKPFFAIQPHFVAVNRETPQAFVAEKSKGLTMPDGRIFHYYSREFDETRIPGEFFTIPEFEPLSELFVTERLVEEVKRAGLTGLEFLELVYDDGPVIPQYPKIPGADSRNKQQAVGIKELIRQRCKELWWYSDEEADEAVNSALEMGYIPLINGVPTDSMPHEG